MPTPWKRSPEELHKVYVENTEAFYRVAGRACARELDAFMQSCAVGLWARAGAVTQAQVDAVNELYSKGRSKGTRLLWELTGEVCSAKEVLPPMFFWSLAEREAREGRDYSRVFVRMVTNILLHLAAVDDDVSSAEAEFITDCADRLSAVCDSAGVKPSKPALNARDFVTSGEPSFIEKHPASGSAQPSGEGAETFALIGDIESLAEEKLTQTAYLVGDAAMGYEMDSGFDDEMNLVTLLTIAAIFLIVLITFRTVVGSAALVAIIQGAVFITTAVVALTGAEVRLAADRKAS